jgi:hypothetical protein
MKAQSQPALISSRLVNYLFSKDAVQAETVELPELGRFHSGWSVGWYLDAGR